MSYRQPIGFKVTDNKLSVIEIEPEVYDDCIDSEQVRKFEILLKIANFIDAKMQDLAKSMAKNDSFSKHTASEINNKLDKIYIKYYEKV